MVWSTVPPLHRARDRGRRREGPTSNSRAAFGALSASLDLLLLPTSIEVSGSAVTRWRDESGQGHHATPTGGVQVDLTGSLPSVRFNGSTHRLDGALGNVLDSAVTIFVLNQTVMDNAGNRGMVIELSDAGFERSVSLSHQFTNVVVRSAQVDEANASQVPPTGTELDVALHVGVFAPEARMLITNGQHRAGSAVPVTPARTDIKYRLGQYLDGSGPWNGRIFAVAIFRGTLTEKDREAVQSVLLALAGLGEPFRWPFPAATNAGTDLLSLLTPEIDAVVGRRLDLFKWGLAKRDGTDVSLSATSDLGFDPNVPDDRWSVTASAAGTYAFSVTSGAFTSSTNIVAVDFPGSGVTAKKVAGIGDSNMARAVAAMQILKGLLGARISFLGTVTPPAGYTSNTEGWSGQQWPFFNTSGSPLWAGGPALDIPGWITAIGGTPDGIILAAGQNDVYNATPATVDAVITNRFTNHVEPIIAALQAAIPGVVIWVSLNYPLAADPAMWNGDAAVRTEYFYKVYRYAQRVITQFGGREASNIFLLPTFFRIDPVRGYGPEAIHMVADPGHRQLAETWLAAFCRRFWS